MAQELVRLEQECQKVTTGCGQNMLPRTQIRTDSGKLPSNATVAGFRSASHADIGAKFQRIVAADTS